MPSWSTAFDLKNQSNHEAAALHREHEEKLKSLGIKFIAYKDFDLTFFTLRAFVVKRLSLLTLNKETIGLDKKMLGVSLFASFSSDKRKQIAVRAKYTADKYQEASTSKDER